MKWEYLIVMFEDEKFLEVKGEESHFEYYRKQFANTVIEDVMNKLGAQRWELICVLPRKTAPAVVGNNFYFKRPY